MALVEANDVVMRLDPQPHPDTHERISVLIDDAEQAVRTAFLKAGRDLDTAMSTIGWLQPEVERVIREMVSAAIIIGPNAGVRTVTSTTGQESDSITYADVDAVSFGGIRLTDAHLAALGITSGGYPRGRFPRPIRWPEVRLR